MIFESFADLFNEAAIAIFQAAAGPFLVALRKCVRVQLFLELFIADFAFFLASWYLWNIIFASSLFEFFEQTRVYSDCSIFFFIYVVDDFWCHPWGLLFLRGWLMLGGGARCEGA